MFNLFNEDDRRLNKIRKQVKPIIALADKYAKMSDKELKGMTPVLKYKLAEGATLDDIYVDAFATAREASRRVLGLYPHVEQLMAGIAIHDGDIAEQATGEGKTLTSVMPAYLNALEGKGVHIVTVNEYLSKRDAENVGRVFQWLGLTVGINAANLPANLKQAAFNCDITYTTNSELGFDYLRDHMVISPTERVLRDLHFALIDEADSILLDDSRTPLIISGGQKDVANLYLQADRIVKRLKKDEDYEIDVRSKTVQLTEDGSKKIEKAFKIDNLYNPSNMGLLHHISQALKANYIMIRDIDYVVNSADDEILIVDPNTGRTMKGRQWSDGLHQAVEAKEGISIKQETSTVATITYQNFFRLYDKLSGMTGTAKTDEEEFLDTYNMFVVPIPTHKPIARKDLDDAVYGTKKAKYDALIEETKARYEKGQPVLIGTIAIETSEVIADLLKKAHLPHNVLNAKNHEHEAEIIANAGQKGAITIATNMAGRGTDIKLGEGVAELGGLCVLGSERHESRRIDNQLRGRSGRQGDPGISKFFVSVEDDLMKRFGSERLEKMFNDMKDEKLESKLFTKSISNAQERIEGVNYDSRKNLMQYDDVLSQQRHTLYEIRDKYVDMDFNEIHNVVKELYNQASKIIIERHSSDIKNIDYDSIVKEFDTIGFQIDKMMLENRTIDEMIEYCSMIAFSRYEKKISDVKDKAKRVEKIVILQRLDDAWANHINVMNHLKSGMSLRGYAQSNPIQAYVSEGYQLYKEMMDNITLEIISFCNHLKIEYH